MADWLTPTFVLFPFAAWMFLGVGMPWALVLLPRSLWRDRITVLAVALALGPLGYTAVMLVLGLAGKLTLAGTLAGSVLVALTGAALARRQIVHARTDSRPQPARVPESPLPTAEALLIVGLALILLTTSLAVAYWPFTVYDPLWVFAANGRLFVRQEHIPSDIGYYPQLMALSYTTMQQAWGALGHAAINDHAARTVLPWYNLTMTLMAYTLGRRLFRARRVGLLTAAAWLFYPHVPSWMGSGDLEALLTLYFTGAALFFVEAWRTDSARLALLSGVLLGGALWTKPTGGALALGIMLAVAGWSVQTRQRPVAIWPKLHLALIAGAASAPLGGVWYVRNLILGHAAVDFPAAYWHGMAQRSGQELGWPLLIALLVVGGLAVHPAGWLCTQPRRARIGLPLGVGALLLIVTLLSAFDADVILHGNVLTHLWGWWRGLIVAPRRLDPVEALLILALSVQLAALGRGAWESWPQERRTTVLLLWALLLPYGVVWFFDFSYHYRLSFAIVPLLAVQVAALIDGWLWPWLAAHRARRVIGIGLGTGLWALALWAGFEGTYECLRANDLPDDTAKYEASNSALMVVVHMLENYAAEHGQPVVCAPGEDRLPFFFPTWDIRNVREPDELPVSLADLEGVDIYIHGSVPIFLMKEAGLYPNSLTNRVAVADTNYYGAVRESDGALWTTVLEPIPLDKTGALHADDGIFRFTAYRVRPELFDQPVKPIAPAEGQVIFGDFALYLGHNITSLDLIRGDKVFLTLYWRPTDQAPPARDYRISVHLLDASGQQIAGWDSEPLMGQWHTSGWEPGESLLDYWVLSIPADIPAGPASLRIGLYDPATDERLPVTIDGDPAGDGLTINTRLTVR